VSRRRTRITRRDATGRPIAWEGDDPPGAHVPARPRVHQPPRISDLDKRLAKLGIVNRRR
jgi:hypothetical protein